MILEPIPEPTQATIDMIRGLKGPPVRRPDPEETKALSAPTVAKLLASAAVGASEAHYPWWTLWLLPVGYRGYREHPREMPKDEAFAPPVRS